jgi:metallo-beta-lactamase class B
MIISNIRCLGLDPAKLSTIILAHCHIDHAGGVHKLKKRYGGRIIMHERDAWMWSKDAPVSMGPAQRGLPL